MATQARPVTRFELQQELRHYATKEDLANLKADLIKWLALVQLTGLGAVVGAMAAMLRFLA